jgi:hypothetical protein
MNKKSYDAPVVAMVNGSLRGDTEELRRLHDYATTARCDVYRLVAAVRQGKPLEVVTTEERNAAKAVVFRSTYAKEALHLRGSADRLNAMGCVDPQVQPCVDRLQRFHITEVAAQYTSDKIAGYLAKACQPCKIYLLAEMAALAAEDVVKHGVPATFEEKWGGDVKFVGPQQPVPAPVRALISGVQLKLNNVIAVVVDSPGPNLASWWYIEFIRRDPARRALVRWRPNSSFEVAAPEPDAEIDYNAVEWFHDTHAHPQDAKDTVVWLLTWEPARAGCVRGCLRDPNGDLPISHMPDCPNEVEYIARNSAVTAERFEALCKAVELLADRVMPPASPEAAKAKALVLKARRGHD